MSLNKVTVTIPDHLYRRLQSVATENNQEIADILIASAEAMLTLDENNSGLSPEVVDDLAAMRLFNDDTLV